jgi:hypothetical protein
MAALGHQGNASPPVLSAGFGFVKPTFAGTRGNGRNAPILLKN